MKYEFSCALCTTSRLIFNQNALFLKTNNVEHSNMLGLPLPTKLCLSQLRAERATNGDATRLTWESVASCRIRMDLAPRWYAAVGAGGGHGAPVGPRACHGSIRTPPAEVRTAPEQYPRSHPLGTDCIRFVSGRRRAICFTTLTALTWWVLTGSLVEVYYYRIIYVRRTTLTLRTSSCPWAARAGTGAKNRPVVTLMIALESEFFHVHK